MCRVGGNSFMCCHSPDYTETVYDWRVCVSAGGGGGGAHSVLLFSASLQRKIILSLLFFFFLTFSECLRQYWGDEGWVPFLCFTLENAGWLSRLFGHLSRMENFVVIFLQQLILSMKANAGFAPVSCLTLITVPKPSMLAFNIMGWF